MMKNRIWELDALRGLCILGMVAVHLLFDLTVLYGIIQWDYPPALLFLMNWGGVAFFLISGICATLGSRSLRRGLTVLGCGLIVSAVTAGLYLLGMADRSIIIWCGVLHCLGLCMILWPLFRRLPAPVLGVLGALLAGLGLWMQTLRVESRWLFWLGLMHPSFTTSDYFPLFPWLGFFLLGAMLGRILYRGRQTLFPRVNNCSPILGFLQFIGRWSLPIYLAHQPLLTAIVYLILCIQEVSP